MTRLVFETKLSYNIASFAKRDKVVNIRQPPTLQCLRVLLSKEINISTSTFLYKNCLFEILKVPIKYLHMPGTKFRGVGANQDNVIGSKSSFGSKAYINESMCPPLSYINFPMEFYLISDI